MEQCHEQMKQKQDDGRITMDQGEMKVVKRMRQTKKQTLMMKSITRGKKNLKDQRRKEIID